MSNTYKSNSQSLTRADQIREWVDSLSQDDEFTSRDALNVVNGEKTDQVCWILNNMVKDKVLSVVEDGEKRQSKLYKKYQLAAAESAFHGFCY